MRVPALDGLRGLSIGLVILCHGAGMADVPKAVSESWLAKLGVFGVEVFFGISGFIITHLLLAERARTGAISLRRFYMRRLIRIVPACYVLVAFVAALSAVVPIYLPIAAVWAALSFTTNVWLDAGTWYLGHTWSLAAEEQFYLVWPATLVLLAAWPEGRIIRLLAYVLAASVPVSILSKLGVIPGWLAGFLLPAFPIYAGCLLAILHHHRRAWLAAHFERRIAPYVLSVALAAALFLSVGHSTGTFAHATVPARVLVVSFAVAYLVGYAILRRGRLQRVLDNAALAYVGTLSYSLYLWQQVFFTNDRTVWDQALGPWYQRLLLVTAAAIASFYLIEKPLWKLRSRLRT